MNIVCCIKQVPNTAELSGDGFLIAGDSGSLFNALHREGSNMAMTSGRLAAETIIEAFSKSDSTGKGLWTIMIIMLTIIEEMIQ
jgi:flavin-dependent dehydrogenase